MKKNFLMLSLIFSFLFFCLQSSASHYEEVIDLNELKILTPTFSDLKIGKICLTNGLKCYLISDPKVIESAVAFSMSVGSWSDPKDHPGMAHFVEHLLFMGNKTYPEEDGLLKYVLSHGGKLNAFTLPSQTVYMFSMNHESFLQTLHYFSHMFIDPLFPTSSIERELHAVDQEHDKNIENDNFRQYMILKEMANPNHPNARFATGNKETLKNIPRSAVVKWHEDHYSANKAHLILYSPLPLEKLKELSVQYFSQIPSSSEPKEKLLYPFMTDPNQEGKVTFITPIKEIRKLTLFWEIPKSYVLNLEDKSDYLLSYILKSRHPNSFFCKLKEEKLIEDLCIDFDRYSKEHAFYSIDFILTPQGVHSYESVINRFFQALHFIKNEELPAYIFNDMSKMLQINYEYQGRRDPFEAVKELAYFIPYEPFETFPQKTILPSLCTSKQLKSFIHILKPEKGHYHLIAFPSLTKIKEEKIEPWSGAKYTTMPIGKDKLLNWTQKSPFILKHIHPNPNPFIPSNLKLIPLKEEKNLKALPQLIVDNPYGKVYFWQDHSYLVPEVSYLINIKSPILNCSAKQAVLFQLFQKCLEDHLKTTSYYADAASLVATLNQVDFSLLFTINGFNEKANILLNAYLDGFKTCYWTKEEFEHEKKLLMTKYQNFKKSSPLSQGADLLKNILYNSHSRNKMQLDASQNLTYDDFLDFQNKIFEKNYIEMLLVGNLTKQEAQNVWGQIRQAIPYHPYPQENHLSKRVLVLSSKDGPYKISESSKSLGNSSLLVLQEGSFSYEKWASATILARALSEDFFDTLRTKQQTAYIVQSNQWEEENQLFQLFMVQSSTHHPEDLLARFELFLEKYVKDFDTIISQDKFETLKKSVIKTEKKPPTNLSKMAFFLYHLAFKYQGDFKRKEKKIQAVSSLDYATFKQNSLSFLSRKNSKRIAVMIEGKLPQEKSFYYKKITPERLKNRGAYISSNKS